jgi:hypothetical protein
MVSFSLTRKGEQYEALNGELDSVAQPGTTPTQGPHLLSPSLATLFMGI